jgi:hypothetical protein
MATPLSTQPTFALAARDVEAGASLIAAVVIFSSCGDSIRLPFCNHEL